MKLLLVDDDQQSLESTRKILEHAGHQVEVAESGKLALDRLQRGRERNQDLDQNTDQSMDAIVTDVRMPGMSGFEFVEAYQKLGLKIPFIVMTAFGQVQDAVWAMKMGATDFLLKPFKRQQLLDAVLQIQSVARQKSLSKKTASAKTISDPSGSEKDRWGGFIGSSKKSRELELLIDQVARTDASVLLLGESGSGKERVARAIHALSPRAKGPFVAVNCAAIPENLLESELYGYERGAFSGATHSKMGLFESAQGGTLLLDEIGDLPLSLQPKLLRVLEDQKIRRLGSHQERQVNVRMIAATHQNLADQVKRGLFRQDLYYRLDVMTLAVPPLRDRIEDIPELTQFFLSRFAQEHRKAVEGIDSAAQATLMIHDWPGNIRELSNVLERAVILSDGGRIQKTDLPQHLQLLGATPETEMTQFDSDNSVTIPLGMSLKEIEDLMIQKTLAKTGGDRSEAAKLLGVNERTIYRRIRKTTEA